MNNTFTLPHRTLYFSLLGCLFLPNLFIVAYAASSETSEMFLVAMVTALCSCSGGWFFLRLWEKKLRRSFSQNVPASSHKVLSESQINLYEGEIQHLLSELSTTKSAFEHQITLMQSSVAKSKEEVHRLYHERDRKLEEMRVAYLEFEDLRKEYCRLEEERAHTQKEAQKAVQHKDSLISEYQKTISEQRLIIEKKQRYIYRLEEKIQNLTHEIQGLLHLDSSQNRELLSRIPYDHSIQLQNCIEKAENLTGVDHLGYLGGNSPRFLDLPLDCYALDRRRLFDCFKEESNGAVFIYSPTEKKFLFVHPLLKTWTGWGQEKFTKDFPHLVAGGYLEWKEAVTKTKTMKKCHAKLILIDKVGQPKPLECYMALITKGPLTHHVIGIFS